MPRFAILTDAHANLPALEAALTAVAKLDCDAIYHTGDLLGIGPYPAECLELALRTPRLRCLRGNHEEVVACGLSDPLPGWVKEGEVAHFRWVQAQLDPALRSLIAEWPLLLEETIGGQRIALLHYAPAERPGRFKSLVRNPSADDLDRLFGSVPADLVFYGHDHAESDIQGRARYVNPGSLGCFSAAIARFVVLDVGADGSYDLTKHAVPYDDADLFRQFDNRKVPDREFITRRFLPRTPTT